MAETFGERLSVRIAELGPLCVGVDPSRELLEAWNRPDSEEGLEFFSLAVLEAVAGVAAAIKPQVAFFERFGAAGYRVLERLIAEARAADVLVVGDAKRGDIASTNEGYAEAWLTSRSPLAVDALTVHPYLGVSAFAPLVRRAGESGRGIFVVAASSNEEGRAIQAATAATQERVEDLVLREVAQLNRRHDGRGTLGAVLGATREPPDFDLARLGGPCLVPGLGAQGASAEDVGRRFASCAPHSVLVNLSRSLLGEGPSRRALGDAARRWRDDLAVAVG
jgi:orotidine-5'-phosphate decarboxylase